MSREWTFAMIDLAGFTALTEVHGDDHAADLATEFSDLARASLGPADLFVKAIGDAVLLAAPDPTAGLRLVERILAGCQEKEEFLITRSGLHHGPATQRGDDFFGSSVNLTARLAAHASAGQVLGTGSIANIARDLGIDTSDLGATRFKNVAEPTSVHTIHLGPVPPVESIDPVCRMRVDHTKAAGFVRDGAIEYWFCSLACVAKFAGERATTEGEQN